MAAAEDGTYDDGRVTYSGNGGNQEFFQNRKLLVALLTAAREGNVESLAETLADAEVAAATTRDRALAGFCDGKERCAAHFAANFGQGAALAQILAWSPSSLEAEDDEGNTPLHLAVVGDSVDAVRVLLAAGANVEAVRKSGDRPLHIAARNGYPGLVRVLLTEGRANPWSLGPLGHALHEAAAENEAEVVEVLLDHLERDAVAASAATGAAATGASTSPSPLATPNAHGMTPLLMAAAAYHLPLVDRLARAGSPVSVRGVAGLTALHFAAEHGDVAVLETLLAQPDGAAAAAVENDDRVLPIQLAAGQGHRAAVDALWEASVAALEAQERRSRAAVGVEVLASSSSSSSLTESGSESKTDEAASGGGGRGGGGGGGGVVEPLTVETLMVREAARVAREAAAARARAEAEAAARARAERAAAALDPDVSGIPLPAEASEAHRADALRAKERGNGFFERGKWAEAIVAYTEAIGLDGRDGVFYGNRSAAYLKLNRPVDALRDARMARRLKPDWTKGPFREGQALQALGRHEDAAQVFFEGVKIDSTNMELVRAFQNAMEVAKRAHARSRPGGK